MTFNVQEQQPVRFPHEMAGIEWLTTLDCTKSDKTKEEMCVCVCIVTKWENTVTNLSKSGHLSSNWVKNSK